ncbi:WASH complex subunit CCDC53 [Biomphalaria glabrata]|uniref:WASH complex subunit 3-like n=1 Tax=Biomphalaria glabrata TaxID=6526 RepID=A0A2C9M2W9_BIOGL|nr:WASH complex subunit 3-like [Biomphalaria glabrata]XP_055888862.1 WASH complex subunit 3-like [Biomphalaria glabrata]XP_055888863.1 WASH complex subunit 3-like [Biomphalaria glabrata]XP_055888865.1 WASH complex subunit 3-like [Biomphalaria glabrata]KAI8758128.1 WASH complex subunit CCDC53-like [Biomphalaria glabrata]KAI8791612.1 WASH complex subunit CCDC53 [Biomphalaria glabrata]
MDNDGLPLVGPGIDYTKVEAISQKRTIAFINHFITHTARFLNRFGNVCEEKLEHLHGRLQQLEISLSILEAKLSSIPGLETVTVSQSTSATPAAQPSTEITAPTPAAPVPSAVIANPQSDAPPPPPPEETKPTNTVSQDPRYMKFFKMLQFGVPPPAVKGKMAMEGLNPDLLDTPDAPAPAGGAPTNGDASDQEESDSDASFSD